MQDEGQQLLSNRQGVREYQSFDNPAIRLDDEETDLAAVTQPLDPLTDEGAEPSPISTVPGGRVPASVGGSTERDGDTTSIVTIGEDEEEEEALSGEEILFRLRLAHIYGDVDWTSCLRRLHDKTREDVHMQILDTLREQPISIHRKIQLSRYLRDRLDTASVSNVSRAQAAKRQDRTKQAMNLGQGLGIWKGNITNISAYFGSHVASYFVFLRFLVYLDLLILLLLLGLVSVPQIISDNDAAPESLSGDFGSLSRSVLFFGAYSDTKWGYYDRPLAYLLSWAAVNVLCFLVIVASMYIRYSRSKRSETSEDFPFSARLLASWDFTLTTPEGASLRTKAVVTNTKEMVREERHVEKKTCCQATGLFLVRLLVNVFVFAVLGGSGYVIYLVADSLDASLNISSWIDDLLETYKLPLVVAALKVCVPPLFDQAIRLERYAPRTELKVTIARTALFYLASIVVFVLSMYDVSTQCIRDANSTAVAPDRRNRTLCCWENQVGEEVVKLVLTDLGQILLTTLIFDYLRAAIIKCGKCSVFGYREFTVASEVLDVIYGQSLVWLGLFFSPLLSVVGFIKLVVVFYFRYLTARLCKVPPRTVFRASRSGNFFMFILLVNFFVCLFIMTYAVIELEPSTDCGPFKPYYHAYDILTSRVGDLPTWLRDVIVYVSTPAIVAPFILFLLLGVLYFKAKSASYAKVIGKLRQQLKFERRVEKREVFARARIVHGQRLNRTGSTPRLRRPSAPSTFSSLSDINEATTITTTTTTT